MTTDPAVILRDLVRAALDDCNVLLPPVIERRLLDRITEMAALAGITIDVEADDLDPPRIY